MKNNIDRLRPMEISEENPNCIIKAFEEHSIFIIREEIDDKKYYYIRANEIGSLLDIVNIRSSIQNFEDDEMVVRKVYDQKGAMQDTKFLTSRGVYRLLYSSKKPLAKKFRKWAGDILDDINFNDSNELKKKLEAKNKELLDIQEIVEIKNKQLKDKDKDNENKWMHTLAKTQASFQLYEQKSEGLYLGAHVVEAKDFIYKFGKSDSKNARIKDHSVSSNDLNEFKMIKTYFTYKELHIQLESFIQTLLHLCTF
jgi:prophage antirepressor-like protein